MFQPDSDGMIRVHAMYNDGKEFSDDFETVIFATGRDAETPKLGLDKVHLKNLSSTNDVSF